MLPFSLRMIRKELLVLNVREQCHDSGSLDSLCHFSLMNRTGARDSLRENLASFRNIFLKGIDIFVIDICGAVLCLLYAELADLSSSHAASSLFHRARSPFFPVKPRESSPTDYDKRPVSRMRRPLSNPLLPLPADTAKAEAHRLEV